MKRYKQVTLTLNKHHLFLIHHEKRVRKPLRTPAAFFIRLVWTKRFIRIQQSLWLNGYGAWTDLFLEAPDRGSRTRTADALLSVNDAGSSEFSRASGSMAMGPGRIFSSRRLVEEAELEPLMLCCLLTMLVGIADFIINNQTECNRCLTRELVYWA
ncbi:hypothetical protein PoB_006305600 [Plakobranchus ocellatus]|uniref:Uncharacterized protein n=1 Tax=Plakobranchus ocellatus TaxID=259542 RepID=A0AAV4CXC7_9GAST|nr:hypothetical protein PoB_006305600 [Plakobranchus ocellatus]